jgi:predicted nucleotidyltransferase component of viral defense system
MAEVFLGLSLTDRREVLEAAIGRGLDRSPALLEKDVWVVWALRTLFAAPFGDGLVFKGGTSLSKAYDIIRRFSEDVDLTYDIRRLPDPRVLHLDALTAAEAKSLSRRSRKSSSRASSPTGRAVPEEPACRGRPDGGPRTRRGGPLHRL